MAQHSGGTPDLTTAASSLSATTVIRADFRSDPSIVSRIRPHLARLYGEIGQDADLGDRLSMVVYELLENVAKYGVSQQGSLEINFDTDGARATVHVRTRNAATPERLARLRHALETVTHRSDAMRLYDDVIARRAETDDGESGLGLARVRAEGQMRISYSLEGESVTIDAEWSGSRDTQGRRC